ncbi:MAG TPA: LamG domain-containing protein [Firmicutes bacterium]|nr:LamG domain-containing protein [Candidatus Fermentithermobacillaceae bacterium]
MPGDLIKLFDTQADWQSGTLENLDATSSPGVIIPTGDYTKTYDSKTEWDQGTKANVVSDAEGRIMLDRPLRGNTGVGGTGRYEYDEVHMGQRISPRGLLAEVRMNVGGSSGIGRYMYVTDLSGYILWYQSMSSHGLWVGYPNLLVSEDVIVWVNASDWLRDVRHADSGDYPPGVTENGRIGSSLTTQPNYSRPLWVNYRCEYAESGTWLSPWLTHGIADPQSGIVSLRAETPSGTSVTPHVRYSSDGGSTYTDWHDLDDRRMTDLQGTHVQLRLTLTTDDTKQTPVVDRAMLLVGKLHRWTSPVIDLAGVDADATLMLSTSQTELDVVREVRECPNFTFTRSSTAYNPETGEQVGVNEPRFVAGPFPGSKALLVEEGTENLILDSEAIDAVSWKKESFVGTITPNATAAPNGTNTADQINITNGYVYRRMTLTAGRTYTFSCWVKSATGADIPNGGLVIWCYNGAAGSGMRVRSTATITTSWQRLSVSYTAAADETDFSFMVAGVAITRPYNVYVWGAQVEAKEYPTSYMATSGASVTRSPETLTIPTAGVLNDRGPWTVECWAKANYSGSSLRMPFAAWDKFYVGLNSSDKPRFSWVDANNVQQNAIATNALNNPTGWHYWTFTWDGVTARIYVDGVKVIEVETDLPKPLPAYLTVGWGASGYYWNGLIDDLRISSIARSDEEILAAYQAGQPLPVDEWTTYKMTGGPGPWEKVGVVFPCSARRSLQTRLTLTKTDSAVQSLDSVALWDAIVLKMLDRPQLTLSPPQVTHVTAYVENSEPLIEYTASLPGVPEAKKVHIRVPVPEGSSLAYCQEVAERVLIGKSKERLALVCQVPLITRLRFSELVPVSIPYIGYTRSRPYLARVQKMVHDVLAGNPHTRLWLGDFLPDDAEALVRLLLKEG